MQRYSAHSVAVGFVSSHPTLAASHSPEARMIMNAIKRVLDSRNVMVSSASTVVPRVMNVCGGTFGFVTLGYAFRSVWLLVPK